MAELPASTIGRLIAGALGPGFACTEEAKGVIAACCKELIQLLASESNEKMRLAKRSRTMPDHLLLAMDELGLQAWRAEVEQVARECAQEATEATEKAARSKRKLQASGKTPAQLQEQQQEKFKRAREKMQQTLQQQQQQQQPPSSSAAEANLASLASANLADLLADEDAPAVKRQKIEIAPSLPLLASSTYGAL